MAAEHTAKYVDDQIVLLKNSGIPLSEAAWKAALLCIGFPYIFGDRGQYCTPAHRRAAYNARGAEHPTIKSKCKNFDGNGTCSGCQFYPGGKTRAYDCRGFTYWILLMIFGWKLMGGGCTAQWNNKDNWKKQGEVKDGIPQGVIVCLFYYKKDDNGNRTKTLAHTGLYYNGQTCECSNGVQHSTTLNAKWEVWGVPACVDGDVPTPVPPEPPKPEKGTAIVTGKNLALREGPTTSAKILGRYKTGTVVKLADIPDGWVYVNANGKKGFMMKKYLEINE